MLLACAWSGAWALTPRARRASVLQTMTYTNPKVLDALLTKLADAMTQYIRYQIDSGAQCVQIFDSWGGQLPPREWDRCAARRGVACRHDMRFSQRRAAAVHAQRPL